MNQMLHDYLIELIPDRSQLCMEMEEYANANEVPIMDRIGMEALLQILRIHAPKSILEIGAAIGYSAIRMTEALPDTTVVTMERDEKRIEDARQYIKQAAKQDRILLLEGDALELGTEAEKHGPYDVIFIDAAKGQYTRFFEIYEKMLAPNGIIISDNVLFKEEVCWPEEEFKSRRRRALVRKIKNYNAWLMKNQSYHTAILPVGDGMAISKKKEEQ
ncbi:MAG: O-methyltransferase [Bacillus sp. (in: firmicutes)]